MATIRDIAATAGVSTATVSRYLNGHIKVREETRRRIEDAVQELRYQPNYLARSLVLKETQTIGVVIPDILNPYFSELARGVEDEASRIGWSTVLCNSDNEVDKELAYLRMLRYKHVDGIVLVSSGQSGESLQALLDEGVSLVLAARRIDSVEADTVAVENTEGAYQAVRHLIDLGHRRIATITGIPQVTSSIERLKGYRSALSEARLPVEPGWTPQGGLQVRGGYSAMKRLLRLSPQPTAVFAANDLMAIGAINAIQEQGGTVPDDVSVVGFDGISMGDLMRPRLTTIAVAPYRIGRTACRLLLDRVFRKKDPAPRMFSAKALLQIKESTGPPRGQSGGGSGTLRARGTSESIVAGTRGRGRS